jgi:membrane associated rhomboid family serine protease
VILPVVLIFFEPALIRLAWRGLFGTVLLAVPVIFFGIVYTWGHSEDGFLTVLRRFMRPVPAGMVSDADLKMAGLPVVTIGLILTHTVIFFTTPTAIVDRFCFLSYSELDLPHILRMTVAGTFFHADFGRLFGNMIFLWAFGAALESRLGLWRYLAACVLCSLVARLVCLNLLISQIQVFDDPQLIFHCGAPGASGAVAGLMGIFVVRCYFARWSFRLPVLFNLPFSRPLQVNGILLIVSFLAMDLAGSVGQIDALTVTVDYGGHVGAFLGGLMLAVAFDRQGQGSFRDRAASVTIDGQGRSPALVAERPEGAYDMGST